MIKKILNFQEEIEDKYGDYIVFDESKDKDIIRTISTGSLSLDVSTGVGGIPIGRFTELYGAESSGKTTLAVNICKTVVNSGKKALYIDAENTLDFSYIEAIVGNFNRSNLVLVQPETAEQSLSIAESGINSEEFEIIVLDSIGSLAPQKEKEKDLTDANVALLPNLMTRFARRNAFAVRKGNTAFLGINQVRDKIGGYVTAFDTPGGHSWKHILSLKIMLSKAEDIVKQTDGRKDILGILSRFTIKKNKLAPPFRTFTLPIIFGKGVDYYKDVVEFSEMLGVIQKKSAYYYFEDVTLGQGKDKTAGYLLENPQILDKIVKQCYNVVNKKTGENTYEYEKLDGENL